MFPAPKPIEYSAEKRLDCANAEKEMNDIIKMINIFFMVQYIISLF
jgi:hypothetical protein